MHTIRLLYIEENSSHRDSLSALLKERGFSVAVAEGVREGLAELAAAPFDVVLGSEPLPSVDGLSAVQLVKQLRAETPVIVLTPPDALPVALEAVQQGAYRYLVQPAEINDLDLTIRQAIEHASVERRLAAQSQGLEETVRERSDRIAFANRQLAALNKVSNELIQLRSEERLIEAAPRLLTKALEFDRAILVLLQDGRLEIASICFPKDPPEMASRLTEQIRSGAESLPDAVHECARTGRTIFIPDLNADPRWPKPDGRKVRTRGMIISPIRAQDAAIGVLVGNMQHHDREMDDQDVARFEMFANMVGLAFENSRSHESLERLVDERTSELHAKTRQLENSTLELARANVDLLGIQERLEEKNAEMQGLLAELSRSKDRLQAIIDSAYYVILMVDQSGHIVATNGQPRNYFGLEPESIRGQRFAHFLGLIEPCFASGDDFHQTIVTLQETPDTDASRHGRPDPFARRALRITAPQERWIAVNSVPVAETGGGIGRVWLFTDVTRLRQAEEQVRALVEAAPIPSIISRVDDGRIIYANDHLADMVGVTKEELVGRRTIEFYYDPADRSTTIAQLRRDGTLRNFELRLRTVDGQPVWALLSMVVTELGGHDVVVGGLYDITYRKQAEDALRRERNFVGTILDTAGALITVLDTEGRIVRFNRACEETTGYRLDEVTGKLFYDLLLPDEEREAIQKVFQALVAGDFPNTAENHWVTKSGEKRLIAWSNTALVDADGKTEYVIATGIDITEIRRAEEKLRIYQRIFDTSGDGITIFDRENRLIARNPAHRLHLGYADKEILGRTVAEIAGDQPINHVVETLEAHGEFRGEVIVRTKSGDTIPIDLAAFQIRGDDGEVLYTVGMGRDIRARKEAEQALQRAHDDLERRVEERTAELRDSETKNRALLSVIPDLIFRLSRAGVYLDYRAPKGSALALPVEQVIGATVHQSLPPELASETLATIARALETADIQTIEYALPHEGEVHFFEARVVVSGADEVLAIVRDITDRKRAEEALRRAHEELEMRVEQRTAQLARVNETLRDEVRERRQAQEALGARLRYEEGLAACSRVLLTVDDTDTALNAVLDHLRDAADVSRAYIFENFEDPVDGLCMRQTHERCAPHADPQLDNPLLQKVPYSGGFERWREALSRGEQVQSTVTQLPEVERELLESQAIKSIIVLPVTVNGSWYGFIGFDDCLSEREPSKEDIRALRTASEMIGVYLARRQAQEALRYSEERFRSLVENARDIIVSFTPDGRFSYISPQFTDLIGHPVSEYLGQPLFPLLHPDNAREAEGWLETGLPLGADDQGFEFRARHRDGSWRWFILNGSVIRGESGTAEEVVGIMHDITDLKRVLEDIGRANRELRDTQAQLVQSEKMASLGMLVAGIAHEINTPVGAISSMHDTLIRAIEKLRATLQRCYGEGFADDPSIQSTLKVIGDANRVIESGANRVTTIVRRLRSFARLDEAELKRVNIHDGLEDTLTLIHHEIKHSITLVREFGELPEISCYPGRLNQVYLNLLNNARQAIDGPGEIHIRTRADARWIYVEIADSGLGIAQEHLARIFDPGFTTKGVGVGTGLGLSICYQIIQEHFGEITVASELGKGTTFTIKLPTNLDALLESRRSHPGNGKQAD